MDIAGRMGHRLSAAYAQLIANVLDKFWNLEHPCITSTTLQDDSSFLYDGSFNSTYFTEDYFIDFMNKFGFQINRRKTQLNTVKPVWAGYQFNLQQQTLNKS